MNRLARAVLFVLLCAACTSSRGVGEGAVESALEAVKGGGGTPHEKALAGWHRYLVEGDAAGAAKLFDGAPDDAVGVAGQLELARRALAVEPRAKLAERLALLDPQGPLGRVGAHTLLDLVGQSPQLDGKLAASAVKVLAASPAVGVSFLCRLVVARVAMSVRSEGWEVRFREGGAVTDFAVAGPFGALRALQFAEKFAPETAGTLADHYATPVGEVRTRSITFPSAEVRLHGEPDRGDIFYLASDVTARGGDYALLTVGSTAHAVFVDGQRAIVREPGEVEGGQHAAAVTLSAGEHRLLLKLSRSGGGQVALSLLRADGTAEDLHPRPATGLAPRGATATLDPSVRPIPVDAQGLQTALAPVLGDRVARFVAARDALPRDLEGTKALLAGLDPFPQTAPWLLLRAQATLSDGSLPDRTARGRAGRDLEAATTRDSTDAAGWLLRAGQARDGERLDDAQLFLSKAEAVTRSPLVTLNQARLAVARGLDGPADAAARHTLDLFAGDCDALEMRYELARHRDAVAEADALNRELLACPHGLEHAADHARARADLAAAARAQQARLDRDPSSWRTAVDLVHVLASAKRYADAEKVLATQVAFWPRNAELHKRIAELKTLSGDDAAALVEKKAALALDGADLTLRRQLALAQGHELLDQFALDGRALIAEYEKAPRPEGAENASSAYVLDLAGIEVLPDGTQLERIHTVAQALDQRGIPQLAEPHLPQGAVPLKLQTIKKDGRVLEPEALGDKEGVSLPNVQVGDYVEVEYLTVSPPRSPAEPGWASVPFYFRIADAPLYRSTYTVEAPAGTPVKVDAHNMEAPAPKVVGDKVVVHHEARRVPLFIPEPGAPGGNEYLPFMQVGVGAGGADVLLPFADSVVGRDAVTLEVGQFARAAVGDKVGAEAVAALFAAVSERVKGEESDINDRASMSLARERGSRLWLLKGALKAVGIPAHVALVRPLAADPAPYLFPNSDLFTYPVLYVEPAASEPLWLDPSVRFGPFNELPEQVAGERDAVLLPGPGEKELRMLRTPPGKPPPPKTVKLQLTLSAEGDVEGQGEEIYAGFDAAFLRQALERYDESQRKQAVEVALARSFRGSVLDKLEVVGESKVNAPTTLRYHFTSPRFARVEGTKLVLATPIFPAALGQRYVALAGRTTPLLIAGSEASATEIRIQLPAGFHATSTGAPASIQTPFGLYQRVARVEGQTLIVDEQARVNNGRVTPKLYPDFVRFTAAVDQAQQQQLELSR
jgi:hypothetical protein